MRSLFLRFREVAALRRSVSLRHAGHTAREPGHGYDVVRLAPLKEPLGLRGRVGLVASKRPLIRACLMGSALDH